MEISVFIECMEKLSISAQISSGVGSLGNFSIFFYSTIF